MTSELWSMCAAVNVKTALPLIETPLTGYINIQALARRIERKYKNPALWNSLVSERCTPAIKTLLLLS